MKIRTLAMYLPQFHRVEENDKWWGEGFTEWTTVRGAEPLFEDHAQPVKPLNNNYYNLLDKQTMIWQSELMQKYGIDGQCFYHYYFQDGRKILEKPAENLLAWKDINMPFCFCWANGRWARTWSNLRGNSWADKFEQKCADENNGVLIEQRYGREKEWSDHFYYLLPFFKDDRYIRIDGKPIFLFFAPSSIPCLSQMIDYWQELAIKESIPKIYFIVMNSKTIINNVDAQVLFAPHMVWEMPEPTDGICRIDYDLMWKNIHNAEPLNAYKTYYCGVPNIDDTPRRGRHHGVLLKNFSIKKFYEGMCDIYQKSVEEGNEFVFINAWNEWGEGTQLEPDEIYGYKKLEAVFDAQQFVNQKIEQGLLSPTSKEPSCLPVKSMSNDYSLTAKCFDQWMTLRENNICIADYLKKYGIKHVAIYGYGMLARHLLPEIESVGISIDYIIDRSRRKTSLKYIVRDLEDEFPSVDAVVITIVDEFDGIYSELKNRIHCKFYSLYEIVSELP